MDLCAICNRRFDEHEGIRHWPRAADSPASTLELQLDSDQQLDALIPCMRPSAQDTLAALWRNKLRIVKEAS